MQMCGLRVCAALKDNSGLLQLESVVVSLPRYQQLVLMRKKLIMPALND